MKSLTRVAFYALILGLTPLSYTHADDSTMEEEEILSLQEAAALINSMDTANDAIGGTVSGSIEGYYDIYARQLSFREKTKVFRGSIEVRRSTFEYDKRIPTINAYKDTQERVFRAETAAYQDSLRAQEDEMMEDERDMMESHEDDMDEPDIIVSDEIASDEEEKRLKEIAMPSDDVDTEETPEVKKKVVTSDDAPDFDPSNL